MRLDIDRLLAEIQLAADETIDHRREALISYYSPQFGMDNTVRDKLISLIGSPTTQSEIDEIVNHCPLADEQIRTFLQSEDSTSEMELSAEELDRFLEEISLFVSSNDWLSGDTDPLHVDKPIYQIRPSERLIVTPKDLQKENIAANVIAYSPGVQLLSALAHKQINLHNITWREFEKVVAELLSLEGYDVSLNRGTKDEGVDIFAEKYLPGVGRILSVWQAKHIASHRRVGINFVRELADTTVEHGASKGVIVTSSYLTKNALTRITRDTYKLAKVDHDDLQPWIQQVLNRRA